MIAFYAYSYAFFIPTMIIKNVFFVYKV